MATVIAPAAINALKEALTAIYWYRSDLRSFLDQAISDRRITRQLDWEAYKRNIVSELVDYLTADQATYQGDLIRLMAEVSRVQDFSHLERLEDGKAKARKAKAAVKALSDLVKPHQDRQAEEAAAEERRQAAYERRLKSQGVQDKLEDLKRQYLGLLTSRDPQKRGYSLEKLLRELFELFDLDPRASFRTEGEQLDGAFSLEGTDFLFEAKWWEDLVGIRDLDAFSGKLSRKLENTLGLFLSINGFSEDAVKAHSTGRRTMILMDGSDLMAVLEERIDLVQLLMRKKRHAAQTGGIYLKIHEIL